MLFHQPPHVGPEHADDADRLDRLDGGGAALVLEHGELAEDVSRAERGERDRTPVAMGTNGPRTPFSHDVAGVAGVALAEDHLPGLEAAGDSHVGDPLEVARLERGERGHPPEQLDNVS